MVQDTCFFHQFYIVFSRLRFSDDIEWMTGNRPNLYWQATWRVISPLMLLVVFLAYVVVQAQQNPTYEAWSPDSVRTTNTVIMGFNGKTVYFPCHFSCLNCPSSVFNSNSAISIFLSFSSRHLILKCHSNINKEGVTA